MPSLMVIIIWLAVAGCMILVGTVLTVRRSRSAQQGQLFVDLPTRCVDVRACSYCDTLTEFYIGVMSNGKNYDPVCLDCQYCTGIRCQDGSINPEFVYQVEQYC